MSVKTIHIRPAKLEDLNDVYEWRNDYDSRSMFINSSFVTFQTHKDWYLKSLRSEKIVMYIGVVENQNIGVCRFDISSDSKVAHVSININPNFRNKGFGCSLLHESVSKFSQNYGLPLIAKIKEENIRSLKIFQRCKFQEMKSSNSKSIILLFRK